MKHIGIVGAGLSGLTVAKYLSNIAKVTLFEKSSGYGGRLATRYVDPFNFDHGAQYFTAQTPEFKSFIDPMIHHGVIKCWHARFAEIQNSVIYHKHRWNDIYPHYVGVPNMNSIGRYLANDIDCHLNTSIKSIKKNTHNQTWQLIDDAGSSFNNFDWVVLTAPAKQTADLMPSNFYYYDVLQNISMTSCFSVMLGFKTSLNLNFDAALIHDSMLSWLSVNQTKPDRNSAFSLLVNSTNHWADQHVNHDHQYILAKLCNQIDTIIGCDTSAAIHNDIHFWRYANCDKQTSNLLLIDDNLRLAACGDWCIQGRIESAFMSGLHTATAIKHTLLT